MSTERIKQLHEQASERYLNGDYHGALQAWRDVLELNPADEQALDGTNMASQFVKPESNPVPVTRSEVESDLDRGLKVLDGIGTMSLLHAEVMDGSVDRKPEPEGAEARDGEDLLEGWEAPPPSDEEAPVGLAPIAPVSDAPSAKVSAAAAELSRRVNDLLEEAKAKADAGERDEALAILFRLAILDEENAEAAALRAKIESAGASDLDKVERAIIEGVAALEADKLDDAERYLREALELVPGHREAQHYLEKVEQRRSQTTEELLSPGAGEAAPFDNAVARATVVETAPRLQAQAAKPPRPAPLADADTPEPALATGGPRFTLRPSKLVLWGGGAVMAMAAAAILVPRLVGGSAPGAAAPNTSVPAPRKAPTVPPGPRPSKAPAPPTAAGAPSPQEIAKRVAAGLDKGHTLMAAGDFGGAVVAFNEALSLDPQNDEARAGFENAGELYKASKAEREALNTIKLAFRDGEFTSGLRLAYRLPPSVSKSYTDGVKFAGWYNLAIVALRAGECREALSHLDEALQIAPEEEAAIKLREFAGRYVDAVKDRGFLDRVEALAFRPLPES